MNIQVLGLEIFLGIIILIAFLISTIYAYIKNGLKGVINVIIGVLFLILGIMFIFIWLIPTIMQ